MSQQDAVDVHCMYSADKPSADFFLISIYQAKVELVELLDKSSITFQTYWYLLTFEQWIYPSAKLWLQLSPCYTTTVNVRGHRHAEHELYKYKKSSRDSLETSGAKRVCINKRLQLQLWFVMICLTQENFSTCWVILIKNPRDILLNCFCLVFVLL